MSGLLIETFISKQALCEMAVKNRYSRHLLFFVSRYYDNGDSIDFIYVTSVCNVWFCGAPTQLWSYGTAKLKILTALFHWTPVLWRQWKLIVLNKTPNIRPTCGEFIENTIIKMKNHSYSGISSLVNLRPYLFLLIWAIK
jgi:hypothetical protein